MAELDKVILAQRWKQVI